MENCNLIIPKTEYKSNSLIKHYALIYPKKFKQKPKAEVGMIHNHFKRNPYSAPYTLEQIMNAFCSGQTLVLSMNELGLRKELDKEKAAGLDKRSSEWADLHTMHFKSSQLLGIDIDDDESTTNIDAVIKHFKGKVAGVYYSFSHLKPNNKGGVQNRYRLLFQFDTPITDYEVGKEIVKLLRDELLELYPNFPIDKIDTMQPKTLWHGSSRPVVYLDATAVLSTKLYNTKVEIILQAKQEAMKARRKSQANELKGQLANTASFSELIEMANKIGHIPSEAGRYEDWRNCSLSIRSHEMNGYISTSEGLQLFDIISGGDSTEDVYNKFNPNGSMTIGTFIKHAKDNGFRRKNVYTMALLETKEAISQERLKIKGQLTIDIAKKLIQRKQKLLIDSPTGSGKTYSFMNAFKELANKEYHFYIFVAPTIPLTEQIAKEHDVFGVTGETKNLENEITNKAVKGERTFVCTYDKTAKIIYYLSNRISYGNYQQPTFTIVIDELHKFTEAYNYRFAAIDQLEQLTNIAVSVIGLSGTPEDILKDNFDALIKIDTGNTKSPCLDYRVFTYTTKTGVKYTNKKGKLEEETDANLADVMLIQSIKGLLKKTKVLCFINNKERIENVSKMLKKDGINTKIVTSDTKQSETYLNIVENGTINDDIQVILSTTVLADGISITNGLQWSCMVVADKASPIFNPSTIKQISNRFRKEYHFFILYMREPNEDYADTKKFHVETDFQYRKKLVGGYVDYLNEEFTGELLQDFTTSKVEQFNGIYYRSTDETALIEFNPLYVRHQSMKRKESYYSTFRHAFIKEVGAQIGLKCKEVINVNEEARKKDKDFSDLLTEMKNDQDQKKKEEADLRSAFEKYFDESTYKCFVDDYEEALRLFKEDVHPSQYKAILKICKLADYETCKRIGANIKKDSDTHKYYDDIKALADIASFDYVKKTSITKRVFKELVKLEGKYYHSKDFKKLIEEQLPKKLKVTLADMKAALKLFHKTNARPGGESHSMIQPLTLELVADLRHSPPKEEMETATWYTLGHSQVKNSVINYVRSKNPHQQKVLLPAITKKWGIENQVTL